MNESTLDKMFWSYQDVYGKLCFGHKQKLSYPWSKDFTIAISNNEVLLKTTYKNLLIDYFQYHFIKILIAVEDIRYKTLRV